VLRFFTNPHKPMILALSRPDPKKNVTTLLKAYGESRQLRELANLVRTFSGHNIVLVTSCDPNDRATDRLCSSALKLDADTDTGEQG
jgi:hypothetical protein